MVWVAPTYLPTYLCDGEQWQLKEDPPVRIGTLYTNPVLDKGGDFEEKKLLFVFAGIISASLAPQIPHTNSLRPLSKSWSKQKMTDFLS